MLLSTNLVQSGPLLDMLTRRKDISIISLAQYFIHDIVSHIASVHGGQFLLFTYILHAKTDKAPPPGMEVMINQKL